LLSRIKNVRVRPVETVHSEVSALVGRVTTRVGGPARLRVVLLLAGVLSLQSADIGTIGALAAQLEKALHADNTELGLLTTAASLVGAVAALPVGVLADRANRVRLLVWATAAWSVGMAASGFADGYVMLLLTRLALGAVIGVSGPVVASLTGDLFPAKERARIYGMVLTGELLGSGLGLVISAELGAAAGWRAPFFVLAVPSLVLAVLLHRLLPEPARGGQSWLYPGAEEIKPAGTVAAGPGPAPVSPAIAAGPDLGVTPPFGTSEVRRHARERQDVEPNPELVLRVDPAQLSPWAAARYVLRIRSNLVLIAASVLGNFFLAGIQAFALLYVETHFGVSQALGTVVLVVIGAGAIVGTLLGGRLADRLVGRKIADGRVLLAGFTFVGAAVIFLPGLAVTNLLVAVPFFLIAVLFVSAPSAPLAAARLDVVPSGLWGRAEAVRTFARSLLQGFAPLLFGYVSSLLGGPHANLGAGLNIVPHQVQAAAGRGLEYTFMIMLVPLLAAGALLLFSRRTYLVDVLTADVSERTVARAAANKTHTKPEPEN
jgi:predicted MFS family arabinose efflux permease